MLHHGLITDIEGTQSKKTHGLLQSMGNGDLLAFL